MSNFVTIESKPAQGATAAPAQAEIKPAAGSPAQGLQVTDRAIKRIRVAMEKEGVSPKKADCVLGLWAAAAPGFPIRSSSILGHGNVIAFTNSMVCVSSSIPSRLSICTA